MDFWDSFAHDPRVPGNAPLRAADADREIVRSQLTEAYADGRLTQQEHEERLATTLEAKTLGELPPIVADLVVPGRVPVRRAGGGELHRQAVRDVAWRTVELAAGSASPFVICTVIWLFTSPGGYFWPMWTLIPVVLSVLSMLGNASARVEHRVKELREERSGPHGELGPTEPGA